MASEKAIDEELGDDLGLGIDQESDIDQAVGDLRDVLKKDAGEMPLVGEEEAGTMGGAQAFGSDFGADFASDDELGSADSFAAEPSLGSDFGLGAAGDAFGGGVSDFGGGDFGGNDFAGGDFGAGAAQAQPAASFGASGPTSRVDLVLDIPVDVQVILGTSRMAVSSLMDLSEGATIALDRRIGEAVDIMVNGKLIGRGEITVLESDETRFGIRMIEVIGAPAKKGS